MTELETLRDENRRLRELIDASEEVAKAIDVLWYQEENERMRATFQKFVDDLKAGGGVQFNLSGCEWCGKIWPKSEPVVEEHVMERAKRHAMTCEKHPLRIERDALQERVRELEATVRELCNDMDEQGGW